MNAGNIFFGVGLFLTFGDATAAPLAALVPSILGGVLGGAILKKMLPKAQDSSVAAPEVKKPAVMPLADDDAVAMARRRQIAEMQARGGRASTILSTDDKLGG